MSDDCEPADGIPWSRNILWLPVSSQKRLTWSTNSSLIVQSTRIEGCMCWTLWNCLAWLHFGLQGRWCMFEQLYSGGDWVHWRWVWFSYNNLIWHVIYIMSHNITNISRLSLRVQLSGGMYWLRQSGVSMRGKFIITEIKSISNF